MASSWTALLVRVRRAVRAFESERTDDRSTWSFRVVLTKDELDGGWVAECTDLPGCLSQGETEDEAIRNLSDAIGEVIAVRIEQQLPRLSSNGHAATREVALTV
jgi:predicted RNase H-like HicB family nuclease